MIDFNSVSYKYQDIKQKNQLNNINLNIPEGQFILITGKSGCGKTTLSKCINGLIPYFDEGKLNGDVLIEGKNTKELSIEDIGVKIGSVFQNPRTQFFTTSTIDEIAFGCQNMSLPKEEILSRIEDVLKYFNIEDLRERNIFELSSGEMQKVAIASCYIMKPQVFLLDEPSANLDPKAIKELTRILMNLKEHGYTIVIMEHRLYYLKDLIDRVIYMDEGKIIRDFTREEALKLSTETLEEMGLRVFDIDKVKRSFENASYNVLHDDFIEMECENIGFDYCRKNKRNHQDISRTHDAEKIICRNRKSLLYDISFKAQSGNIIGIVGKNGCGKTTLAKILTGLIKNQDGIIKISGRSLSQKERIKKIYFVFQDSDYQLFTDSVWKELMLGNEDRHGLDKKAEEILQALGLSDYLNIHPAALSRGQKQRLTIACSLLSEAPILILDEPTSGLDGSSMRQVVDLIRKISSTGKIVFIISHDYEFLAGCCTHILEINQGTIGDSFELNERSVERLKSCLFGKEEEECAEI